MSNSGRLWLMMNLNIVFYILDDCSDSHYLCKSSQSCLPIEYVCDGIAQCLQGEDELDCCKYMHTYTDIT